MKGQMDLANNVLDGGLRRVLARGRKRGDSHEVIARELDRKGVTVSRETVRRWCRDLGIDQAQVETDLVEETVG